MNDERNAASPLNVLWGFAWFGIGLTVITLSQLLVASMMVSSDRSLDANDEQAMAALFADGDLLSYSFLLATPLVIILILGAIRRRGRAVREYLAIYTVTRASLFRWLALTAIVMLIAHLVGVLIGRPAVPEWFATTIHSVDQPILYCVALVLVAPVLEEVLFRGFILKLWLESPLSQSMTVVMVAGIWAGTHFQYDAYDATWVFILGLMLGYARLATRSIVTPLAIHIFWNGVALIQIYTALK